MFQKSSFGWVTCFDAVILDLLSLVGAFFMAYALRHSGTSPITAPGYIKLILPVQNQKKWLKKSLPRNTGWILLG